MNKEFATDDKATRAQKKYEQYMQECIDTKKFDVILNASQFGASNKTVLTAVKIHTLFEADKIDFVHEDNSHSSVSVHKMPEGEVILCMPFNYDFAQFDKVFDELMSK